MAIDIRANVTCSLGPVIAGNISDDYIQGSGLIKTTGSVTINDLITPDINTIVTFSYTKNGIARSIPRTLRVKSSFADPFRRTTQVELGCKLDYLSDLKDRLAWDAFNDPENNALTEEDAKVITIPIYASSVMNECLAQLGITASSNPLTNKFSIAEFDFSSGYFSVLSDLLVSESYCGYLDANEVLQVFSLNQGPATGPVVTANDIIDLSPIGVGNLPGEAVTVSYSTLRLKPPEPAPGGGSTPEEQEEYENNIARINWERSEVYNSPQLYYVTIKEEDPNVVINVVYSGANASVTETSYILIDVKDDDGKSQKREVVSFRKTTETGPSIAKLGNCASAYLNEGTGGFNNAQITLKLTEETYYYDEQGRETKVETNVYEPEAVVAGSSQFDWVYGGQNYVASYALIQSEYRIKTKEYAGSMEQETTCTYKLWSKTQAGIQAISVSNELLNYDTPLKAVVPYLTIVASGLVHSDTTQTINRTGATPERPSAADRTNDALAKGGGGGGKYGTENSSELELALGSAEAQRRIELSMPYAPDDTFYALPLGGYGVIPSDAPAKANLYGRVQNNLLLGNRSGVSIQLPPEKLPTKPFDPIYLSVGGLTAQYRVNAATWAFDSNGILCSTDALLWGAVGGGGDRWVPVAPGITTLPSTPPIIDTSPTQVVGTVATVGTTPQTYLSATFPAAVSGDGVQDQATDDFWTYDGATWGNVGPTPGPTITPVSLIPIYNETVIYDSRIRLPGLVSKFDYALSLLTVVPATAIRAVTKLGVVVSPPAATTALSGRLAAVTSGSISIPVNRSNTVLNGPAPLSAGDENTVYVDMAPVIIFAGLNTPEPAETIIFNFDGADGSTSITSSSGSIDPITASVHGTAALDTSNKKFGTASLYLDGPQDNIDGDWITYDVPQALGLSDFCVEFWIYVPSSAASDAYATPYTMGEAVTLDIQYDNSAYYFYLYDANTNSSTSIVGDVIFDQWQHIACYRVDGVFYLAVDGVVTLTPHAVVINIPELTHVIGQYTLPYGGFAVSTTWIDEVRITFNSSVYGPSNFTVPSAPF